VRGDDEPPVHVVPPVQPPPRTLKLQFVYQVPTPPQAGEVFQPGAGSPDSHEQTAVVQLPVYEQPTPAGY